MAGASFEPLVIRGIWPRGRVLNQRKFQDPERATMGEFRASIDSVIFRFRGKNFGNMAPGTIDDEMQRSIEQILNLYEQLPVNLEVPTRNLAREEVRRAIELLTGRTVVFADGRFRGGGKGQGKFKL